MHHALINNLLINQAFNYSEYIEAIKRSILKNKVTEQSEDDKLSTYGKLNLHRMKRLDKTIQLTPNLKATIDRLNSNLILLVITEGWCGDAAQSIPLFNKMAIYSSKLKLKLILRDNHEKLMNSFLTNGSRSIPKVLIIKEESLEILATWGPRPQTAQQMIIDNKREENASYEGMLISLQEWYNQNKTIEIQREIEIVLNECIEQ